ncbi:MAG: aldo/keto reductase [Spirochaetaceae bacterium]|nr:aldo/keto reductase [Spirochaetaceae bacterium]
MKKVRLGKLNLLVPSIIAGCMRLAECTKEQMIDFIHTALEEGINFFDHADIYGGGKSESVFGQALKADSAIKRQDLIIQSKCGICKGYYDLSKEHIISSVEGILKRLKTDYLDILLLHRPDALVEPEEVAAAFDALESTGKVRYFGVSNHSPAQIQLLQKFVSQPILANQLQFSLPVSNMIAQGIEVNMESCGSIDRDGRVLDYCRLNDITIQAWSPFQLPDWQGCFIDSPKCPELNNTIELLAKEKGATSTQIAAAWILRHPARMQLVAGTANPKRLKEIAKATEIDLERKEWYQLYLAAGHILP